MLSPGHGASLSTTAGITSVITGVMAIGLAAQTPTAAAAGLAAQASSQPAGLAGLLAGLAIAALTLGAVGLYEARNAVCAAMDLTPSHPGQASVLAARALTTYHLGMVGVFTGLGLAACWRMALPLGGAAWVAPLAAALAALAAGYRAGIWFGCWRKRSEATL